MNQIPRRSSSGQKTVYALILTLLFSGNSQSLAAPREKQSDLILLDKVLAATERATAFFQQDYAAINVDGLFGIQLCQGSLVEALKTCSRPDGDCPARLTARLEAIVNTLGNVSEKALPYIQEQDPAYYASFRSVIEVPFNVRHIPEWLGDYISPPGSDTSYNEAQGDGCYSKLFGTFSDTVRTYPKCTVTTDCWDYMTGGNTAGYFITHQLLYLIVAENNGCLPEVERFLDLKATSVREIEKRFCGHIYSEAQEEFNDGNVPILEQDLFLEQSVLCGVLGFQDFYSHQWISTILGWQNARGCFTLPPTLVGVEEKLSQAADRQRKLLDLLDKEAEQIDASQNIRMRRHLLREAKMEGDCLAHKTGLAFGVLGMYIRHLVHELYIP
jgi:hypothetical protein